MPAEIVRLKPTRPCPICGKPSVQAWHPFCSSRCKDIDLNRWLSDVYRAPTNEAPQPAPRPEDDED
jgi:endogenous inhibitor of DNA gyrase (YacG/DUF329 family)